MFQLLLLPSFCLSFVVATEQPSCTASGVVFTWWEDVGVWYVLYNDSPYDNQGTWRYFCEGSGWGDEEATVVCREQGYQFGLGEYVHVEQYYDGGYGHIHCTGSESTLRECDIDTVVQPCDYVVVVTRCFHAPQVYFHSMSNAPHYLVGTEGAGSVEFCVKVVGITDHLFLSLTTHSDYNVYSPAIADYDYHLLSHTMLFEPSGVIAMEQCLLIEITDDALAEPWERFSVVLSTNNSAVNVTTPQVDVYISPSDTVDNCTEGSVTLVSGANNSSLQLVEMCTSEGVWSPVCDHDWTLQDAIVVCRELKYPETESTLPGTLKKTATDTLTSVECKGSETALRDCIRARTEMSTPCTCVLVECAIDDTERNNTLEDTESKDGEKTQGSPGKNSSSKSGVPIGLIAAVVGVVVVVLLVVCVLISIILKKKYYKMNRDATNSHTSENVASEVMVKHIYTTQNPAYNVSLRKAAGLENNYQWRSLRGKREDLAVATETNTHGVQRNPVSNMFTFKGYSEELEYDYVL